MDGNGAPEKKNGDGFGSSVKEEEPATLSSISRAAMKLIRHLGLDPLSLKPSGNSTRLLKGDVLAAIQSGIGSAHSIESDSNTQYCKVHDQGGIQNVSAHVVETPALSPTMIQGHIAVWRKKEGDKIEVGDVLCEIETDKETLDIECLEEGYLAKILAPEGSKDLAVGQPIAVTVEDQDEIQNVPANFGGASVVKEEKPQVQKDGAQDVTSVGMNTADLPPHFVVEMPVLSPTMSQGNIAVWRKKEGDKIEVGDVICEIETDKATLEFECLVEGYLAKILAPESSKDVAAGQPIAITVEDAADLETVKNSVRVGSSVKEEKPIHQDAEHESGAVKTTSVLRISPATKMLNLEHGSDISSLIASGALGTLLKGDALAAIKSGIGSSTVPFKEKAPSSPRAHTKMAPASPDSRTLKQIDFEEFPNSQICKCDETDNAILEVECLKEGWVPPVDGTIKINIDAVWSSCDRRCGVAAVARDRLGKIIALDYSQSYSSTILAAEIRGSLLGMNLGKKLSLSMKMNFILETSGLTLKLFMENEKLRNSSAFASELNQLKNHLWSEVKLDQNQLARYISRAALAGSLHENPSELVKDLPADLRCLLAADFLM